MTNDVSIIANSMLRDWYMPRELAALDLPGLPSSDRGIQIFAKRHEWQSTSLARKRSGRGGGWEYHIDLLPDAACAELQKRFDLKALEAISQNVQKIGPKVTSAPAKVPVTSNGLTAKQRQVGEARAFLCLEVQRRCIENSISERKAILSLVEDVNSDLDRPTDLRVCPEELLGYAALANDRRQGLSRSTIAGWLKAKAEQGFAGLVPQPKKKWDLASKENYPWVPGFLKFYATPAKRTIAHALEMYTDDLVDPSQAPSYDQVKRYLAQLKKTNPIAAHRGREGVLALKARRVYVIRSTDGLLPSDIYTADGKTFDAFVAHPFSGQPFRPEITSILDVATRKCVGYSIGLNEKAYDVAEALRNASMWNGPAAIFYVDNGKGYKNLLLDDTAVGMLSRLGTHKEHSRAYNSQARGIIERFNGTVHTKLAKALPSYCGKDLDREAALKLHKQIKHDLKEFGGSELLVTWPDFLQIFDGAMARYNDKPHSSLPETRDRITGAKRHMSPNECWAAHEAKGFTPITLSKAESDDLARPAERRKVSRGMVTIEKNRYFSMELERYDRQYVMVCYDILDANQVWVRELEMVDGYEVPGRLICVAKFEGNKEAYFPVPVIESAREKKALAAKKRLEDRLRRVEQEQRPGHLLEASGEAPMEMFSSSPGFKSDEPEPELISLELVEPEAPKIEILSPKPTKPRKRVFASDQELAVWAIDHPETLTPSQKKVLAECLQRSTSLELFRLSGIDVDRLRNVLRAAA
ncbi:MAG: Mu transposase C-terminal domain-containing protein [Cohaesibacter sp.]|jgi:putative transposase|nr:Mu transposase C-terminal domain-containing protein [Cohaesibacter sp.]